MAESPTILVIGGPNGAGKSTLTPLLLKDNPKISEFLNADSIARGLSRGTRIAAYEAGRILLERMNALVDLNFSFGVESTLSGRTLASKLQSFSAQGYEIQLVYVTLAMQDLSQQRVQQRVKLGGHDIPLNEIQRRFLKSHKNFWTIYRPLANNWYVYDNSEAQFPYPLIGEGCFSETTSIYRPELWNRFQEKVADHE